MTDGLRRVRLPLPSDKSGLGALTETPPTGLPVIFHVVFSVIVFGALRKFIPSLRFPLTLPFSL